MQAGAVGVAAGLSATYREGNSCKPVPWALQPA